MMGSFLGRYLNDESKWQSVLSSRQWLPTQAGGDLTDRVLGFSYQHLPWHLRLCFTYCSIFPKDWIFDRSRLVQMWMALGYVQLPEGGQLEEVGRDYLDDLHHGSFFQNIEGEFVMHDLVHDFAQKAFEEGTCVNLAEDCAISEHVRHLSVSCDALALPEFQKLEILKKLRTFRLECKGPASHLDDLLAEYKYLRVLELRGDEINEFPSSIGDLKLLRYLDISRTSIRMLPELVRNLCNLQTLRFPRKCDMPTKVLNKITTLRHLEGDIYRIAEIEGIGQLTLLQKLVLFHVGKERGRKITELKNMKHLRGELAIECLENVQGREEAVQADLMGKVHLEVLKLQWFEQGPHDGEVLQALHPPRSIKRLIIRGNRGVQLPTWMKEQQQLPSNLVHLELVDCCNWEYLPPLGQLPFLRVLSIDGARKVKKVGPEFYCTMTGSSSCQDNKVFFFPSLQELTLTGMDEWEEWYVGLGEQGGKLTEVFFPSLSELRIENCPKLGKISGPLLHHTTALEILCIRDCEQLAWSDSLDLVAPLSALWELMIVRCPALIWPSSSHGSDELESPSSSVSSSSWQVKEHCTTDNMSLLRWLLQKKKLRSLVDMKIEDCEEICWGEGWTHLVSLKHLRVHWCPKLQTLPTDLHSLPSLEVLELHNCPEIQYLPEGGLPPSLQRLWVYECTKLQGLPSNLHNLPSLRNLELFDCPEIQYLPEEGLPPSLQSLLVHGSTKLQRLPSNLHKLPSLQKLELFDCSEIQYLPEEGLPPSLQRLSVKRCTKLQGLPSNLHNLPSLQQLGLTECPEIQSLPSNMHNLPSLKYLVLIDCPNIRVLPEGGLPKSLRELYISSCPTLTTRCREGGPDHPKIACIPTVMIFD